LSTLWRKTTKLHWLECKVYKLGKHALGSRLICHDRNLNIEDLVTARAALIMHIYIAGWHGHGYRISRKDAASKPFEQVGILGVLEKGDRKIKDMIN